jgi:hypothetical protein
LNQWSIFDEILGNFLSIYGGNIGDPRTKARALRSPRGQISKSISSLRYEARQTKY